MPNWTCPFCDASMTVKQSLVGLTRPCAKCGQESIISDADAPPVAQATPQPRNAAPAQPRRTTTAAAVGISESVAAESLTSATLVRGILLLATLGGIASFFTPNGLAQGISILVAVIITWPLTTIAEEVYRARRLLQELLKLQ